jgi:hypothetical protein
MRLIAARDILGQVNRDGYMMSGGSHTHRWTFLVLLAINIAYLAVPVRFAAFVATSSVRVDDLDPVFDGATDQPRGAGRATIEVDRDFGQSALQLGPYFGHRRQRRSIDDTLESSSRDFSFISTGGVSQAGACRGIARLIARCLSHLRRQQENGGSEADAANAGINIANLLVAVADATACSSAISIRAWCAVSRESDTLRAARIRIASSCRLREGSSRLRAAKSWRS